MRDRKQRNYGQDQPWREERRQRYPNEPYGAGADYRGDFGPESYGERDRRPNPRATFGFGADDNVERGGSYAYGSPYGQGDMGSDRPGRGDWDADWMPNRAARGRSAWTSDWSTGSEGESYAGRGPKDYRRSDDRIREEICDVFTDDARLDPSEVVVKVEGAEVTLMGSVTTRDQKRRAEELAEQVRGVNDVHNQLRLVRGETTTGATSPSMPQTGRGRTTTAQPSGVAHDRERER
jgi:hypothetical protein